MVCTGESFLEQSIFCHLAVSFIESLEWQTSTSFSSKLVWNASNRVASRRLKSASEYFIPECSHLINALPLLLLIQGALGIIWQ